MLFWLKLNVVDSCTYKGNTPVGQVIFDSINAVSIGLNFLIN